MDDADRGMMGGKLSSVNGSAMTAEIAAGRRGDDGRDVVSRWGAWYATRERLVVS